MTQVKNYIVIGSSRGLGAALVKELLSNELFFVFAVSRTSPEEIPDYEEWQKSGRFQYFQADISDKEQISKLSDINNFIKDEPACIIFNAASLKTDVNQNQHIDFDIFNEINSVGITGFENVLKAFEPHLLNNGGLFVGISSYSAILPPVFNPKVAYPATKVYLDMALRSLRMLWNNKVAVVTVHLGHMKETTEGAFLPKIILTYPKTAKKIVDSITGLKVPEEINIPFLYNIVYRYIFRLIPDRTSLFIFNTFKKYLQKGLKNEN